MTTFLLASAAVAAAAFAARAGLRAAKRLKGEGAAAAVRTHYVGGFEAPMTKAEAALILGVRRSASIKKIRERHRKLMVANHPDSGGSPLLAAKVNEAKDLLLKDVTPQERNAKD